MELTEEQRKKFEPLIKTLFGNQQQRKEIPYDRVTPRWEYIRDRIGRRRGPYCYIYWKDKGKLRKKYIGRDPEQYNSRLAFETLTPLLGFENWTFRQYQKWVFLKEQSMVKKDKVAEEYLNKVNDKKITIDWAYKFVKQIPEKKAQQERTEKLSLLAYKHGYNGDIGHFLESEHLYLKDDVDWYLKSDKAIGEIEEAKKDLGSVT
jgi:hypothetical protein